MTSEWLFSSQFPARAFQPNNLQKSGRHVHESHRAVIAVTVPALALCRAPRSVNIIAALQDHYE